MITYYNYTGYSMNTPVKFRKSNSPAFNPGEIWISANGCRVTILGIRTWSNQEDCSVVYLTSENRETEKEIHNFQVRYWHSSDITCFDFTK